MAPSTQWKEEIPADEAERFERHAQTLLKLQQAKARRHPVSRGLHAKAQAGAEAEFTVLADLPEHARVGLFSKPGTYKALVRYSNGLGSRHADQKGDVRGIAIKVVGVEGKKLIPGLEGAKTQDFLAILSAFTPFTGADDFVWFVDAASRPASLLPRAILQFGFGKTFKLLGALMASRKAPPVISVATHAYFSALPIKFGAFAVHYSLAPTASDMPGATLGTSPNYLGEELAARLEAGPVSYDFRVQFFVDPVRTPIEDASVEWKESDAPWLTVGRLTLPKQRLGSARGQQLAGLIEGLSFDPWHALEDHRPLGNMMRARSAAYRLSTIERKALPEPDGSETFEG